MIEIQPEHVGAYWNRGYIYLEQNRYKLAAVDFSMITELVPGDADGHGMLGWALILQGKLREARETCRKSFRLGPQNYAWVLNLGHTYLLLGESRSAYIFYKTALTLIKTKKELQEGPLADFSLFIAQNRQVNACKKARFWFESSFPKLQEARKLQNGYNKLFLEGKYSQAISLAKKNYEFTNEIFGDKHPVVATSMNDLAKLLRASGRYIDAEPLIKKTLEIRRQLFGDEHPDVGASMNNLAALYYETDRIPESGILLKRALGIAQQAGEPELLYYSQKAFCVVLGASSKTEAAIFFGKQAVNTIQRMRRNVASLEKESRKRFLRTKEYAYKDLSELLIDQGRLAEAAQVLAMLKDEEYFDFIRRDSRYGSSQTRTAYTAEEESWKQRYEKISNRLAALGREVGGLEEKQKKRVADRRGKRTLAYPEIHGA